MRARLLGFLLGLALLFAAAPASKAGPEPEAAAAAGDVAMGYKAWRKWKLTLPAEQFRKVSGAFDFTAVGGGRFAVEVEGSALRVDTDADGAVDARVEGESGHVRLASDGFTCALRLVNAGTGWMYASSGGRVGRLGDVRITLIDQDGNGSYADFGTDAMIVGDSKNACFLSRVINVGGVLHAIGISKDGATLSHRPYDGAVGTLDLVGGCETNAKLLSVVVRSVDAAGAPGALSYDLASAPEGLRVPAGRYVLHSGRIGLGKSVVHVRAGRLGALAVGESKRVAPKWGGPLAAEFAYQRSGDQVLFTPDTVHYFGRAGEEYFGWQPFGKSPVFSVVDTKEKAEIAAAIFTGC